MITRLNIIYYLFYIFVKQFFGTILLSTYIQSLITRTILIQMDQHFQQNQLLAYQFIVVIKIYG